MGGITRRRPLIIMVTVLFCLLVLKAATVTLPKRYWLNLSDSEPVGLYRVETVEVGRIGRGDLVLLDLPEEAQPYVYGRGWLPKGWALFKHVGAVTGDTYCISDSSIAINGVTVGPVYLSDQKGLPLPRLRGCRQVPAGHFLPIATRIVRSFDGRYMGPVPLAAVKGIATPILTWP